jgi:hypothetical protein
MYWPYVRPHILCTQLVICLLSHFINIWYLGWPWSEHAHIIPISRMVDFCESCRQKSTIREIGIICACSDHGQSRYQIWIKCNKRQMTSCVHKIFNLVKIRLLFRIIPLIQWSVMFCHPCFNRLWVLKYIPRLFSEYMLTFRVEEPLAKINHPWNRYNMRMLRSWPTKIPNKNKIQQKTND